MKKKKVSNLVRFANGFLKMTLDEIKSYDILKSANGFRYILVNGAKFEINDIRV
jgi:hypothetical protein